MDTLYVRVHCPANPPAFPQIHRHMWTRLKAAKQWHCAVGEEQKKLWPFNFRVTLMYKPFHPFLPFNLTSNLHNLMAEAKKSQCPTFASIHACKCLHSVMSLKLELESPSRIFYVKLWIRNMTVTASWYRWYILHFYFKSFCYLKGKNWYVSTLSP